MPHHSDLRSSFSRSTSTKFSWPGTDSISCTSKKDELQFTILLAKERKYFFVILLSSLLFGLLGLSLLQKNSEFHPSAIGQWLPAAVLIVSSWVSIIVQMKKLLTREVLHVDPQWIIYQKQVFPFSSFSRRLKRSEVTQVRIFSTGTWINRHPRQKLRIDSARTAPLEFAHGLPEHEAQRFAAALQSLLAPST